MVSLKCAYVRFKITVTLTSLGTFKHSKLWLYKSVDQSLVFHSFTVSVQYVLLVARWVTHSSGRRHSLTTPSVNRCDSFPHSLDCWSDAGAARLSRRWRYTILLLNVTPNSVTVLFWLFYGTCSDFGGSVHVTYVAGTVRQGVIGSVWPHGTLSCSTARSTCSGCMIASCTNIG